MMKRIVIVLLALAGISLGLHAQETVDSLVYIPVAGVDEALQGKNIFNMVDVQQSQAISNAMRSKIDKNKSKKLTGYRVRIFFEGKQDSRGASEAAVGRFRALYPGYGAYRTFASPYFKVTVGDFRTKSEAMQLMQALKADFPGAFVVRENINYPIVDKKHSYIVDTVQVTR